MTNCAGILVDLVVVTTLRSLVTKEVNGFVGDAVGLLGILFEVLEAVSLVPAGGEDVERNLTTNGEATSRRTLVFAKKIQVLQFSSITTGKKGKWGKRTSSRGGQTFP